MEKSRGMSGMPYVTPLYFCPSSPLTFVQKSLIRESENMVRDTAARLERATGELGDLVVRWLVQSFAYYTHLSAPRLICARYQKSAKGIAELEKDAELLNAEAVLAVAPSV